MAGTTLDRQLTIAGRVQAPFALATPAQDADIRRLLRENPMAGKITLTFEREPDYFAGAGLPGTETQTIVANEGGRVICMGNCSIRERFVNGQPRRVGYLGGLRLDAAVAGRFDILRRGYKFFQKLQASRPADFYFTSIAADNVLAQKFLERGLPGMPAYKFVGEFVTVLLPTKGLASDHSEPVADTFDFNELLNYFDKYGRDYQFAPRWSVAELTALQALNLKSGDFQSIRNDGNITACAALWDQRAFKQTVIRRYSPWLAMARPAVNFMARIMNQPCLPAAGSVLAHAFVSHLAVEPQNPAGFIALITQLKKIAVGRKIKFLTVGFAANDQCLTLLRRQFGGREYRSRIYVVHWPGLGGSASDLDSRCLGPEVALL